MGPDGSGVFTSSTMPGLMAKIMSGTLRSPAPELKEPLVAFGLRAPIIANDLSPKNKKQMIKRATYRLHEGG